jgi:hypothetical protein
MKINLMSKTYMGNCNILNRHFLFWNKTEHIRNNAKHTIL